MSVKHSEFSTSAGITEHFFAVTCGGGYDFAAEMAAVMAEYREALKQYSCSAADGVLMRFHLSDVTNQLPVLQPVISGESAFISVVGQPPAGARIALEAWHWCGAEISRQGDAVAAKLQNYTAYWFNVPALETSGSAAQTGEEFIRLQKFLNLRNCNVADNTVRTWLYCRDVDNNYAGLVTARNEFFARNGLTADTHFIASTGIEGQMAAVSRLVGMDSLNYAGIVPGQMIYLSAPEMLSPTTLYGVSFERGTRLVFGDRSHYFISGTASIDKEGKVLYPGDVRAQTGRMLDNIEALLASSDGKMSDVRWGTLYLRDIADSEAVTAIVRARLGENIPLVTVKAPVCRPAWLVELECVAVNGAGNEQFPVLR